MKRLMFNCRRLVQNMSLFCVFATASALPAMADETVVRSDSTVNITIESMEAEEVVTPVRESIFGGSRSLAKSKFTWGAEVGCSVDLGGYDLSTFDLDVVLGYKNSWIHTAGISCGVHRDFTKGNNFIPLMAVFRTAFSTRPRFWFANLKAGYSFNSLNEDSGTHGGFILNAGIGFNLAQSKRFHTYLILSYEFIHLNETQGTMIDKQIHNLDLAQISFGVNF